MLLLKECDNTPLTLLKWHEKTTVLIISGKFNFSHNKVLQSKYNSDVDQTTVK